MRRPHPTPSLIAGALLLAGCSSGLGTLGASTDRAEQDRTPVAPPTATTTVWPVRPREITLDGRDPCALLTRSQRRQLGLDGPPTRYTDEHFAGAEACTVRDNEQGLVARLALVTEQGVEVWLEEPAQVDATWTDVAGFPGLVVRTPGDETFCNVEVDMADNQFLDVMVRDGGNVTPPPLDELCRRAERVAIAAVHTLAGQP
ncbi:MAG TPA: DUF3558 domain-containing protein [Pseudonocardiaceae bacterium]